MRAVPAAPVEWWIVEAHELGLTAMPGRVLAYQGAEVIRGLRYQVHKVRPANMADFGDLTAIKASEEEINHMRLNDAVRQGAIPKGQYRVA